MVSRRSPTSAPDQSAAGGDLMKVLALDIATRTGWAVGEPGATPVSGSIRFANPGAEHEVIFAEALKWVSATIKDHRPDVVVWEAPLVPGFKKGKTNANTTRLLYGLPAVIGAVARLLCVPDIREVEARTVRKFFIGRNPPRALAKKLTKQRCRDVGWQPSDDNEADALAIWAHECRSIDRSVLAFLVALPPAFGVKR
jgi:hypothetical protein